MKFALFLGKGFLAGGPLGKCTFTGGGKVDNRRRALEKKHVHERLGNEVALERVMATKRGACEARG